MQNNTIQFKETSRFGNYLMLKERSDTKCVEGKCKLVAVADGECWLSDVRYQAERGSTCSLNQSIMITTDQRDLVRRLVVTWWCSHVR